MPELRESVTAVLLRADTVGDGATTEPYEAGWASEAIVFVHTVDGESGGAIEAALSADGMQWIDEGSRIELPGVGGAAFARLAHFGNWLRFRVRMRAGASARLTVTLHLKA